MASVGPALVVGAGLLGCSLVGGRRRGAARSPTGSGAKALPLPMAAAAAAVGSVLGRRCCGSARQRRHSRLAAGAGAGTVAASCRAVRRLPLLLLRAAPGSGAAVGQLGQVSAAPALAGRARPQRQLLRGRGCSVVVVVVVAGGSQAVPVCVGARPVLHAGQQAVGRLGCAAAGWAPGLLRQRASTNHSNTWLNTVKWP